MKQKLMTLTIAGKSLVDEFFWQAYGELCLTRAEVGDGHRRIKACEPLDMTELVSKRANAELLDGKNLGFLAALQLRLCSYAVERGFYFRELGVYVRARLGRKVSDEVLFAYKTQDDEIPNYASTNGIWEWRFGVLVPLTSELRASDYLILKSFD